MRPLRSLRTPAAFSLIEVSIAVGIAAFALSVILALLPLGLASNRDSLELSEAISIGEAVRADLLETPAWDPTAFPSRVALTSPRYDLTMPAPAGTEQTRLVSATGDVVPENEARYRVTVLGPTPPVPDGRAPAVATIIVSWPPAANPSGGSAAVRSGSFELVTALDIN